MSVSRRPSRKRVSSAPANAGEGQSGGGGGIISPFPFLIEPTDSASAVIHKISDRFKSFLRNWPLNRPLPCLELRYKIRFNGLTKENEKPNTIRQVYDIVTQNYITSFLMTIPKLNQEPGNQQSAWDGYGVGDYVYVSQITPTKMFVIAMRDRLRPTSDGARPEEGPPKFFEEVVTATHSAMDTSVFGSDGRPSSKKEFGIFNVRQLLNIDATMRNILKDVDFPKWSEIKKLNTDITPSKFLRDVYGEYIDRGLFYQHHLKYDRQLKQALTDECYAAGRRLSEIVPPKEKMITRELDTFHAAKLPLPNRLRQAKLRRLRKEFSVELG